MVFLELKPGDNRFSLKSCATKGNNSVKALDSSGKKVKCKKS